MKHLIALIIIIVVLLENNATAQTVIGQSEPYQKCLDLSKSDPAQAMVFSERWLKVDPSPSALHCRGLILFNQERFSEAGGILDRLSKAVLKANQNLRIGVYRQASRAWQRAGEKQKALDRLNQAASLIDPDMPDAVMMHQQVEILIDRALLHNDMKKPLDSIQDLDQAQTYGILQDRVLIARAKIESSSGQEDLAIKDLQQVLKENPRHAEAQAALKEIVEKKPQ